MTIYDANWKTRVDLKSLQQSVFQILYIVFKKKIFKKEKKKKLDLSELNNF